MRKLVLIELLLCLVLISGCSFVATSLKITDIKMAKSVDDKNQPVDITTTFPSNAEAIYCWFSYKWSPPNEVLKGSWYYENKFLTDSVVELKKSADVGHFKIRRTTEKPLPIGEYRVDLSIGKKVLKSILFNVV